MHRIDAVVSKLLVTSRTTTAASIALGKSYWDIPVAGRYLLADMRGLVAGVLNVASAAGVSGILSIYMQIVQVESTVPKTGLVVHIAFANESL